MEVSGLNTSWSPSLLYCILRALRVKIPSCVVENISTLREAYAAPVFFVAQKIIYSL